MTFAECHAALRLLMGDRAWSLQVECWGTREPSWTAYRETPLVGREHHIRAATPELLVERVTQALASKAPATMRIEDVGEIATEAAHAPAAG